MTENSSARGKLDWLAGVASLLSVVACYGTVILIGVLSLLGISLTLNTGVWAGVIVFFAGLAVFGFALGYRSHRVLTPLVLGVIGGALIVWVMFGSFNRFLEIAGFAFLVAAAIWDWRLKARSATGAHAPVPR